jgi:sec-independent protein translocase protein TatA
MAIADANTLVLASLTTWHVVVILLVVLLLFGGKKLPELARGLARGMRIFKDELHSVKKDLEEPADSDTGTTLPPAEKPKDEQKRS